LAQVSGALSFDFYKCKRECRVVPPRKTTDKLVLGQAQDKHGLIAVQAGIPVMSGHFGFMGKQAAATPMTFASLTMSSGRFF
jgi:hypothetical protein